VQAARCGWETDPDAAPAHTAGTTAERRGGHLAPPWRREDAPALAAVWDSGCGTLSSQ